jgi:hypothetical protein
MAVSCIVVVPVYNPVPTEAELLSLASFKKLGQRYPICFVAPKGLAMEGYIAVLPEARVLFFAKRHFASVEAYSLLTASLGFYLRFVRYTYMLLVQTDAAILNPDLESWLAKGYSYIGAPWVAETWLADVQAYAQKRWRLSTEKPWPAVGNGGASLRSIRDFIKMGLLYKLRGTRQADWLAAHRQEDVFWAQVLGPGFSFFTLPNEETATLFACETTLPASEDALPFAVHAFEKYNKVFWQTKIAEANAIQKP